MLQNVFQNENLAVENVYPPKFLLGLIHYSSKTVKKWCSKEFLIENYLDEADSEMLIRFLKMKSRNRNYFFISDFFLELSNFWPKYRKSGKVGKF